MEPCCFPGAHWAPCLGLCLLTRPYKALDQHHTMCHHVLNTCTQSENFESVEPSRVSKPCSALDFASCL